MNFIYKSPFDFQTKVLNVNCCVNKDTLLNFIYENEKISSQSNLTLSLYHNGKLLRNNSPLSSENGDLFVQVCLPVPGGKGGFGSMLRAIGAQIEKTTNREACRDLSGRRLRDVNEEKRIKDWIKKQADRKKEEDKKRIEKLKRLAEMTVPSNCEYNDTEFEKDRSEIPDIVEDSINYGLKQNCKSESGSKRKSDEMQATSSSSTGCEKNKKCKADEKMLKKQVLWLGIDLDSDDSEDSENDEDGGSVDNPKLAQKQ